MLAIAFPNLKVGNYYYIRMTNKKDINKPFIHEVRVDKLGLYCNPDDSTSALTITGIIKEDNKSENKVWCKRIDNGYWFDIYASIEDAKLNVPMLPIMTINFYTEYLNEIYKSDWSDARCIKYYYVHPITGEINYTTHDWYHFTITIDKDGVHYTPWEEYDPNDEEYCNTFFSLQDAEKESEKVKNNNIILLDKK